MTRNKVVLTVISFLLLCQGVSGALAAPANVETYDQLVAAIRETRAESKARVEQAVAQENVREAWETGKLIDEHILLHKERAEYDKQVLVRLAGDLGTSRTELSYMLQFARAYPIVPHAEKLNWSDYRNLLSVDIPEKREALTEQAEKENWDRARLRQEIRNVTQGEKTAPETVLTAQPGTVGTYRVFKATVGKFKGELVLDLGFSNYFKPEKTDGLQEGDIVTLENGKLKKSPAGMEALYTYRADVVEVIDGDTFTASIPLGFGFTTVQKLRLRGLDAPEIQTVDGQEAKAFLEEQLQKNRSSVIIKSVKFDKYDRYLADVFVAGVYVNQELVDEGLAVIGEG